MSEHLPLEAVIREPVSNLKVHRQHGGRGGGVFRGWPWALHTLSLHART